MQSKRFSSDFSFSQTTTTKNDKLNNNNNNTILFLLFIKTFIILIKDLFFFLFSLFVQNVKGFTNTKKTHTGQYTQMADYIFGDIVFKNSLIVDELIRNLDIQENTVAILYL